MCNAVHNLPASEEATVVNYVLVVVVKPVVKKVLSCTRAKQSELAIVKEEAEAVLITKRRKSNSTLIRIRGASSVPSRSSNSYGDYR